MHGMKNNLKIQGDKAAERENQNLPYRPSYPIDFFLWLNSSSLDRFIEELAKEIDGLTSRKNRDEQSAAKFRYAIKVILLNLLLLRDFRLKTILAVPLSVGRYSYENRYGQQLLSYRTFIDAYDGLKALKYIKEVQKGHFDKEKGAGKVTRIDATEKLQRHLKKLFPIVPVFSRHPDEETILLKNNDKELIDYNDTKYSKQARKNLTFINNLLDQHWYDLDTNEDEFRELQKRLVSKHKKDTKKPVSINFSARTLYRIYNNSDFKQGGRFYRGWWEGIPSAYRPYITINGHWTVEVDYSNLHPFILYAKEGYALEEDAYTLSGLKDRDMAKIAFNKLINGKRRINTPADYDADEVGMEWKDLLIALQEKHHRIKKYFRSGHGLFLMRQDSDVAEKIILHFAEMGYPCLPVHDSFIIHHALVDELKQVMLDEFQKVFGQDINLKMDDGFVFMTNTMSKKATGKPDNSPLFDNSPSERRWIAWEAYKAELNSPIKE